MFFMVLPFDKKTIYDGSMAHSRVFRRGGLIVSDFRKLSFCGPYGPCFLRAKSFFKSVYQ